MVSRIFPPYASHMLLLVKSPLADCSVYHETRSSRRDQSDSLRGFLLTATIQRFIISVAVLLK